MMVHDVIVVCHTKAVAKQPRTSYGTC